LSGCQKKEEELEEELILLVRKLVGPVAAFKLAIKVPALPRTRSGKTPRKTLKDLAQDETVQVEKITQNCLIQLSKIIRVFIMELLSVCRFPRLSRTLLCTIRYWMQ
jgi:hypothetical protein